MKSRVINEEAINSSEFTALPSSAVAPDKAFFHRFFGSRAGLIEKGLVSKSVRRKSKSEDADDEDGDLGEEGIDRFADKLAEDLMASSGAGDPDVDDDDFEGLGSGDDNDDDGDDGGLEFDADDGEGMDDEDVDEEGDYDQLVAYGDEVEMVNEESDQNESSRSMVSKGARKRHLNIPKAESKDKKKKKSESGFADAAEYEDIMEQIVQYHAANKASTGETSDSGGERMRKKSKSKIGRRN